MSEEGTNEEKPFVIERAKQGRAACKKCKQKCATGELRIAKLAPNPFGEGKMKTWHHVDCIFEAFKKQRATTKRIEAPEDDIDGWDDLSEEDRTMILEKIKDLAQFFGDKISPKKPKLQKIIDTQPTSTTTTTTTTKPNKDRFFRTFRKLVADVSNVASYIEKTKCIKDLLTTGSDGNGFNGDLLLYLKFLLPAESKRIYNLQSKQLVKLFARILQVKPSKMSEHLEQSGDVAETIQVFFEESNRPITKSVLTMEEVDEFLGKLEKETKEAEQMELFEDIMKKCTANDLKIIIRLIKHDLRMNAGAKHVLQALHKEAYSVYQSSRDLNKVIEICVTNKTTKPNVQASISILTPILPMLAEACKSVEQAMSKCPSGMYAEVKYDGERVQVHKQGDEFKFYSRSLKPVLPHKVRHFVEFIPKAFPRGEDLILDSEVLMVDTTDGKPLPFGTLGKHKKDEFKNAVVCLYVFDCVYYNGESLVDKPLKFRKKVLRDNMVEIPNRVVFSECVEVRNAEELSGSIAKVLGLGLEGLVLKDFNGKYEPGKRHWLKVKKDYLFDGAMADTADLIVLGAWYGTGKKGGMMSVFLMGCYDHETQKFVTVTKVHTGHDDKTLESLQNELKMVKVTNNSIPDWLSCTKTMIPDFVAENPKNQPVWEVTGAEFTKHDVHTANGISIRFPRVTRIRDDKNWKTATNLNELENLYENSKHHTDVTLLTNNLKRKQPPTENSNLHKMIKVPLPDYFVGVQIFLEPELEEALTDYLRYFVAYGGRITWNCADATHVIHSGEHSEWGKNKNGSTKTARHVTSQWLIDSVCEKTTKDWRPYVIYL